MKRLLWIAVILTILTGCSKDKNCKDPGSIEGKFMNSGTITGLDPRDCMCCGGWFIEIKDTVRRFDQVPPDCVIDFYTVKYPLKVKLDWKKKDTVCLGDEIRVSKLVLDE
ncbi:MAG: lipoprotein [Bacteroidia bacterium]|nr:lipoprotein [Bacteroidia bacterium]